MEIKRKVNIEWQTLLQKKKKWTGKWLHHEQYQQKPQQKLKWVLLVVVESESTWEGEHKQRECCTFESFAVSLHSLWFSGNMTN